MAKYRIKLRVRFNLRRDTNSKEVAILAICNWGGERYKYPTGLFADPDKWMASKEHGGQFDLNKAVGDKELAKMNKDNARLQEIKDRIVELYHQWVQDHGAPPQGAIFRALLKGKLRPTEKAAERWQDHVNSLVLNIDKEEQRSLWYTYTRVQTLLEEFGAKEYPVEYSTITTQFYKDLVAFMKKKGMGAASINKYTGVLKVWITEALDKEAPIKGYRPGKWKREELPEGTAIALTEEELDELENMDLSASPALARTRDIFVLGCTLGQRWGDLRTLTPAHVGDRVVTFPKQKKTSRRAVVPRSERFDRMWSKWGGEPPRFHKNLSNFNRNLAKVCARAELLQAEEITEDGPRKRCDMVASHTMRRTCATLLDRKETPLTIIQHILGHATPVQTAKYLRYNERDITNMATREVDRLLNYKPAA